MLKAPGKLVALGVLGDKVEKIEIPLRVAHDAGEIVDLKQAQIAMIILDAFLLELGALLGRELVSFAARPRRARPAADDKSRSDSQPCGRRPSGRPVNSICSTPRSIRSCNFSPAVEARRSCAL